MGASTTGRDNRRGERGALAERLAAAHLEQLGLTLLDRNLRVARIEIDLLARDGSAVALVEVRTRGTMAWTSAFESIRRAKQRRLRRAAHILWSRRFAKSPGVERMRFDVVSVDLAPPTATVEHIKAAFV